MSRKKYKKDMDQFKPDVAGYNRQKSAALERAALTAGAAGDDAGALVPSEHGVAHAPGAVDFYRDANTFIYGDHKPSEDAIDRVVGKLNIEYVLPPLPTRLSLLTSLQPRQAPEALPRAQGRGQGRCHLYQRVEPRLQQEGVLGIAASASEPAADLLVPPARPLLLQVHRGDQREL